MSATRSVATVFGGSGFIGRYVVKRLTASGYVVRVAARNMQRSMLLRTMGTVGQMVPLYAPVTQDAPVQRAVESAELVVNLVGILAEHGAGEFNRIHAEGAGRIARAAAAAGVRRMVHLSAIGADPESPSLYGRSKAAGEAAVRQEMPGATILRPSVVFGAEDQFFNRFGAMAQYLPFMPVVSGDAKLQPVFVGDVADAVMAGLRRPDAAGAVYELGGPRVWTMREILTWILQETQRRKRLVEIPAGLARLQAKLLQALPGRMLTEDQLRMLSRDNVVAAGMPGLAELGIVPTPVELVVPDYLGRFKPGGGRRDIPEFPDKVPNRT